MEQLIREYCESRSQKRFKTVDLLNYIKQKLGESFIHQGGYPQFVVHIETLVNNELLKPVKAWKQNGMQPPLYNGYLYLGVSNTVEPATKQDLLTKFHPRLNLTYYLNDAKLYEKDCWFLEKIDQFFKFRSSYAPGALTINERSFELFNDEKWLATSSGQAVLQRLGLSNTDFECHWTYEPFFYYQCQEVQKITSVLIVENKDTFFTFKSLLQRGINTWQEIVPTLLIYGEGNKILHSFAYIHEVYPGPISDLEFWYFGDLDPMGINIWYELDSQQTVPIKPATRFYTALLDQWSKQTPQLKTNQRWNQAAIDAFLSHFGNYYQKQLLQLLENNHYLPQEGLHGQFLHQLSKQAKEIRNAVD